MVSFRDSTADAEADVPTADESFADSLLSTRRPTRDVSGILHEQHRERAEQFDNLMQQLQNIVDAELNRPPAAVVPQPQPRPQPRSEDQPPKSGEPADDWKPLDSPEADSGSPTTASPSDPNDSDSANSEAGTTSQGSASDPASDTATPSNDPLQNGASDPQSDLPDPQSDLPDLSRLMPTPQPKPSSVFADGMAAEAIIDGPVDRIGLADNLYAMGELQIALEMYQQVDLKQLSESEWYWVKYQIASCYRRLGQISDAQDQYRRLAGQKNAGWLATTARWWLDQMDARAALQKKVEEQEQIITALTEVLNDDVR
jgi:tetratricopeptide (TPR) repeat protein